MSDLAWIALIIVVYLAFIKPMMQGVMQTPQKGGQTEKKHPHATPEKKAGPSKDGDYVDYEEIK
jgi:hypothetical protein